MRGTGREMLPRFHGRFDGEAGTQLRQQRIVGEADLHRDALHDLGEVAGRVLRRQQRELGAGAGREALDLAAELMIAEGVDGEGHRLALGHPADLRLLEIGEEIDVAAHRDDGQKVDAGLNELADADRAVADDAVDRRPDRGVAQVELRLVELGLCAGDGRDGALRQRLVGHHLLFRGNEGGAALGERALALQQVGAGLLGALGRTGAAVEQVLRTRGFLLGEGEGGFGIHDVGARSLDLRLLLHDGGLVALELGHRLVEIGLGFGDRDLVVGIVDGRDHVARLDRLVVGDEHRRDEPRHLGGDGHLVGLQEGVVGRLLEAADRPPVPAVMPPAVRATSTAPASRSLPFRLAGGAEVVVAARGRALRRRCFADGQRNRLGGGAARLSPFVITAAIDG